MKGNGRKILSVLINKSPYIEKYQKYIAYSLYVSQITRNKVIIVNKKLYITEIAAETTNVYILSIFSIVVIILGCLLFVCMNDANVLNILYILRNY